MFGAQSEYRPLRKVLMHTPRESIEQINESSYDRYLFMTPIFKRKFIEEHEAFVDLLRSEGVDVLLVEDLLKGNEDALTQIRKQPNLTYVRDTISIMRDGYVRMKMKMKVRAPEPRISELAVQRLRIPCLTRIEGNGVLEGGDFVYHDEETLMIGVGERSNRKGVAMFARRALQDAITRVIMVPLSTWNVHLDGALMIIDRGLALGHLNSLRKPATVLERQRPPRRVDLAKWLKEQQTEVIQVDAYERFMRGTNVLCLAPRKCVIYRWLTGVSKKLEDHGVDVLEIEGTELLRGGGGPHCMTAPILRL
jgi:N-dimethylarginine dimethylaminohydrolase